MYGHERLYDIAEPTYVAIFGVCFIALITAYVVHSLVGAAFLWLPILLTS